MFSFVFIFIIIMIIIGVILTTTDIEIKLYQHFTQTKYKSKNERQRMFIDSCRKNGIKSLKDLQYDANKKRAIMIAKQCEFHEIHDVVEFYKNAVNELKIKRKKEKEVEKKKALTNQRIKENELLKFYTRFSDYVGNEKRIAMLSEKYNEYYSEFSRLNNTSKGLNNIGIQKERDWAIAGGIASGIAGGAAGLATALDVQAQNQRIRESNARQREYNATNFAPLKNYMSNNASFYLKMANEVYEELKAAKIKVVSDLSKEEVFKNISVEDEELSVSETGAIRVSATVGIKEENINYFDDNSEWVIDGTFKAVIYNDTQKIGIAELVAPLEGIYKSKKLQGICIVKKIDNPNYRFEIEPKHIWVMEK